MPDRYTVSFHAQQCVEKILKALLVYHNIDFPKTHDIGSIFTLLPPGAQPTLSMEDQERLSSYAIGARYPGFGEISMTEAKKAVAIARRMRKEICAFLSKGKPTD